MRSLEIVIRTIAVVAIIVFVSSCASKEAKRIMDTADAVMWTRPDRALAALKSIDTLNLKAKAQRARYSLLYTMALDRNHRDIPDLRIIKPAASYYERHGSNDDRMKMYFYLGVAQYDTGDPESAIELSPCEGVFLPLRQSCVQGNHQFFYFRCLFVEQ